MIVDEYTVYDKEGNILVKGTAQTVAEWAGMTATALRTNERNGWSIRHLYPVRKTGTVEVLSRKERQMLLEMQKPKLTRFEQDIDYLVRHLRLYGNTVMPKERHGTVEQYLEELKTRGYECCVEYYKNLRLIDMMINEKRLKRAMTNVDCILTLKGG